MKALKVLRSMLLLLIVAMLCVGCYSNDSEASYPTEASEATDAQYYTIKYHTVDNGVINGEAVQEIENGGNTTAVTAVPNDGFTFERWSDGVTTATRTDTNVTEDMVVYPIFKAIPYTVTYRGLCDGKELFSYDMENKTGTKIEFDASAILPGYKFLNWNDGRTSERREDGYKDDGAVFTAYFEEIIYPMPTISINITGEEQEITREVYLDCTVKLESEAPGYAIKEQNAQIRGRGNYTWTDLEKHSYRLKFDKKVSMLGSENKAKNWVLLSNGFDNSLARTYIGHELAERFETIKFASMHEFAELYLNGEYVGLYLICDLVEVEEGRVELNEDLSDPEDIAFLVQRDSYAPKENKILDVEYFLLENDYNKSFEINFPDPNASTYKADVYVPYIKQYVKDSLDAIGTRDWELIQQYIDVENFAEMYILHECMLNLDVGWNSFYMYKDKGGKLCLGPAWDFDLSAGNYNSIKSNEDGNYVDAYPAYDVDFYDQLWGLKQNTWLRRMARVPEFQELLKKKLDELDETLKDVYSLADPDNSEGLYQKYGTEMNKNLEKWGIFQEGPAAIQNLKTIEAQHEYLYNWLNERLEVVRTYYGMPPEKTAKKE